MYKEHKYQMWMNKPTWPFLPLFSHMQGATVHLPVKPCPDILNVVIIPKTSPLSVHTHVPLIPFYCFNVLHVFHVANVAACTCMVKQKPRQNPRSALDISCSVVLQMVAQSMVAYAHIM